MKIPSSKQSSKFGRFISPVARIAAASALTLVLAACSGHNRYSEPGGVVYSDSGQAHPIMVSKKPIYLDIDVERGSGGLTRSQENHVRGFLHQYRSQGSGELQIASPSGTPNETAAFETMRDIRGLISEVGLSESSINIEPYHDEGDHQPPIKISFARFVAEGPTCGDWSDNLGESRNNSTYKNYGCATQKNLAAIIANPRDLIQKRGHGPRDGGARDRTFEGYAKGEDFTSEPKNAENAQSVSGVGQ